MKEEFEYDVAISFAEEDRNAALALALELKHEGFNRVYYYPDKLHTTTGENLREALRKIFSEQSQYIIILISEHYFKDDKFTWLELEAVKSKIEMNPGITSVIPVRLNPEFNFENVQELWTIGFVDWNYDPQRIAKLIKEKLGKQIVDDQLKDRSGDKIITNIQKTENSGNIGSIINKQNSTYNL